MSAPTQVLRNRDGIRIGDITFDYDGIQVLRDRDGQRLGEYDPKPDVTRDRDGRRIGDGNILTLLLRS